jgi:DNA helicase II / ATP-dependent DNA helicase PcrA
VLPAAADAARQRRFQDPAIRVAAATGRLAVTRIRQGNGHAEVIDLARAARQHGHSVSIFTHTIAATAALSDALSLAGLTHEQVGFGEGTDERVQSGVPAGSTSVGWRAR